MLIISENRDKFSFFRKFSRKYKNEGDYNHNYFLVDLLHIFSPHQRFTPKQILKKWQENTDNNDFLSIYVHIPFCIRRCDYCVYSSNQAESRDKIEKYVENILKEIDFFGRNLDRKFNTLYFGGGTPSILSAENIDRILSRINHHFSFEENGMRSFEINPATCTEDKLDVLEKNGINRLSFGVQSTSNKVLEKSNRGYQTFDIVRKSFERANNRSFRFINMDLILGLQGSSKEQFIKSFEDLVGLGPSSICVYPLQPTHDLLYKMEMTEEDFFEMIEERIREVKKPLSELAENNGYHVPPTPNPRDANSWMFEREKEYEVFDHTYFLQSDDIYGCLGFGVFQESYISEVLSYNRGAGNPDFEPDNDIYGGILFERRDYMIKFILEEFANGNTLSTRAFKEKFGSDIEEEFEEAITNLKNIGLILKKDEQIVLDVSSPLDTFAACYFFLDTEEIKHQIREEANKNGWNDIISEMSDLL